MTPNSKGLNELRRDLTERIELALTVEKDDSFMEFKPSQINILIEDIKDLTAERDELIRRANEHFLSHKEVVLAYETFRGEHDCQNKIATLKEKVADMKQQIVRLVKFSIPKEELDEEKEKVRVMREALVKVYNNGRGSEVFPGSYHTMEPETPEFKVVKDALLQTEDKV